MQIEQYKVSDGNVHLPWMMVHAIRTSVLLGVPQQLLHYSATAAQDRSRGIGAHPLMLRATNPPQQQMSAAQALSKPKAFI
jgi:hypothetical protein